MATRAEIVATARSFIGTPFHHQGRLPGVGLDCAGVPIVISWRHGIKPMDFDVTGYARAPDGSALKAYCDEHMVQISLEQLQPADVVLVRWRNGPPQHLGLVADYLHGGLSMIHAEGYRHKKVMETRLLFGRAMCFVAAYSIPGVS